MLPVPIAYTGKQLSVMGFKRKSKDR